MLEHKHTMPQMAISSRTRPTNVRDMLLKVPLTITDYSGNVHDSDADYMEFLRVSVNESNPLNGNSSRPNTRLDIDKEAWSKMDNGKPGTKTIPSRHQMRRCANPWHKLSEIIVRLEK